MKFILFCLIVSPFTSYAQWDSFSKIFSPKPQAQAPSNTYKLIQPPKDKKQGNFTVTCTYASGEVNPAINALQIKQIETGFSSYTFLKLDGKVIIAPVDFCYIIQN